MSGNLFSIVIPTRERHDTLKYSIQSVLHQTYREFELVVMDNFSSPETAEVVKSFDDPRIKYYRAPERLSMSDNWELGLSHATGEYIFILGDDDALMPDGLEICCEILKRFNLKIVSWRRSFYWWPTAIAPWRRNLLSVILSQEASISNPKDTLNNVCKYQLTYENLPTIYNSFIHRDVIEKVKSVGGRYFMSYCPDIYSGIVNSYFFDSFLYSYRPLSVAGISGHSTGASHAYRSMESQPYKDYLQEHKTDITERHPALINSDSEYIILADVFIRTKELFFPDDGNFAIDIKSCLSRMALRINVDSANYETTLNQIKALAQKYGIPLSALNIPAKLTYEPQAPQGPTLDSHGSLISLAINCEQAGITNVAQAAMLVRGILPPISTLKISNKTGRPLELQKTSPAPTQQKNLHPPTPPQKSAGSPEFLKQLAGCANLYQIDPSEASVTDELRQARKQLADFWLSAATDDLENLYSGDAGKSHQILLSSGIKEQQLTETERVFAHELAAQITEKLDSQKLIQYLLAATLYRPAGQMPVPDNLPHLPNWFLADYERLL
ncbi:glycosyltransferase family 2 protein [Kamptonema formosum]|uniref:glycosyltransferase family 2 protein n=1 Tax=Kamptonema formosum TaxID=331992 RepID=UPI00034A2882|nr:glycosyltransferase family 2 protein [Oscillatoria sp. PCC 10802]